MQHKLIIYRLYSVFCLLSSTSVENPLQIGPFLQNKANVKIGKMNISIVTINEYDKEQRTINNERYSKQTQTKPISNLVLQNGHHEGKMFLVAICRSCASRNL